METSQLAKTLSSALMDSSNVITPTEWNMTALKYPIVTETWVNLKGIIDSIIKFNTKSRAVGHPIMVLPNADKKLLEIKKYLDQNWQEFAHEEKGLYAHNLFNEILLCLFDRLIYFYQEALPSYLATAKEHPDYTESLKIQKILDLANINIVRTCPDKHKLSEALKLETFQAQQFQPMLQDQFSYHYILILMVTLYASKLKNNFLDNNDYVNDIMGYSKTKTELNGAQSPVSISDSLVAQSISSHDNEIESLEFIIDFLSMDEKLDPEHLRLITTSPCSFYFESVNFFQIKLVGPLAKNEVNKQATLEVIQSGKKSKKEWAKRAYVQQLLLEDIQNKFLEHLVPEEDWSDFEDHDKIMEYFDSIKSPNGIKNFISMTKHEIRSNQNLDMKNHDLTSLDYITPASFHAMFEFIKNLYIEQFEEYQNGLLPKVVPTNETVEFESKDLVEAIPIAKKTKPINLNFDPQFFFGETSYGKNAFIRQTLNKTIGYLNQAAIIANNTNPENLLSTMISLILFPDKFNAGGAIFAKSKISIFQGKEGILQPGDLEIKVTDGARIFLRDAGNKIQVVFVGNPQYHR